LAYSKSYSVARVEHCQVACVLVLATRQCEGCFNSFSNLATVLLSMTQSRDPFANARAVYLKVVLAIHEFENGNGDNTQLLDHFRIGH